MAQARRGTPGAGHLHVPETAKRLFGPAAQTGFFVAGDGSGTRYFAMPGPYEKVARRDALLDELKRFIARTRSR